MEVQSAWMWLRRANSFVWPAIAAAALLLVVIGAGDDPLGGSAVARSPGGGQVHQGRVPSVWSEPVPDPGLAWGQAVIGGDEREQIADTTELPFAAIAFLGLYDDQDEFIGHCTGSFVGPDAILTAAHCLYSAETGKWTGSIRVVPGRDGASEPFGYDFAAAWWVPDAWIDSGGAPEWDWGIISLPDYVLNDAIGSVWFIVASLADPTLAREDFEPAVVGYPGDKPLGTMWGSYKERFLDVRPDALEHDVDTYGGESGSAVFSINLDAWFGLFVAGIHVRGGTTRNEATRVSEDLLNDIDEGCKEMNCLFEYYIEEPGASATPTATATPTRTPPAASIASSYFCNRHEMCQAGTVLSAGQPGLAVFDLNQAPTGRVSAEATLGATSWQLDWDPPPYAGTRFHTGALLGVMPGHGKLTVRVYVDAQLIGSFSTVVVPPLAFRALVPGVTHQ